MSNRGSVASSIGSSFKSISRTDSNRYESSLSKSKLERNSHLSDFDDFPIYFVDQPPSALICKCCDAVFRTPVVLNCGHTACKSCAFQYANCPVCGNEMRMVIENLALVDQIGQLGMWPSSIIFASY